METFLSQAERQLGRYSTENVQTKLIIERFDEVLTEKANKHYVDSLRMDITATYVTNTDLQQQQQLV